MRSVVVKSTIVLSSGSLGASGKMQYHAIWHSIVRHISPFPEREWWQSPHFTFHTNKQVGGIFAFSFQWKIWVYYKADLSRCGQEATAGREQCSCDAHYKKKKTNPRPPYSEAELWHFTQWPFPLAGALANYLTLIQSLCVCQPDIHRLARPAWLQK